MRRGRMMMTVMGPMMHKMRRRLHSEGMFRMRGRVTKVMGWRREHKWLRLLFKGR
jgi:hypothetical protein